MTKPMGRKAILYSAVEALHAMHFTDAVIAKLLGIHRVTAYRLRIELGLTERWTDPKDVVTVLPQQIVRLLHASVPKA